MSTTHGIFIRFLIFSTSSYISAPSRKRHKGTAALCQLAVSPIHKRAGSPGHGESALGVRTAGNTNLARTYHHKRTGLKRLSVFG